MFLLYEVALHLVFLLGLPFYLLIGFLRGKYLGNFAARLGFYPMRPEEHDLWIHAVSVGETLAARPVIAAIERLRPGTSMVITTTTLTGQAQARRLYPRATVTYFPFDFTFSVRRFLDRYGPKVYATMETEIWPNVTRIARARGVRLILTNGRISDRSFPRYRALRFLIGRVLSQYECILARETADSERFRAIGAPPGIVETSGNVKFDYTDPGPLEEAAVIERMIGSRKVLVLGSTMEGEDEALLPEVERLIRERNVFVVMAPRKPGRFEQVAGLLATTSLAFVRRTELTEDSHPADILLLDTMGELAGMYAYATAAFVGGTLAPFGGHNPIEPAAAGVPVCFGPSMSNFREIAGTLLSAGAAIEVRSAAEVIEFAERMFDDEELQKRLGERARDAVVRNRGASEKTARRIVEMLS